MVPAELRTGLSTTGPARSAEQAGKQPAARLELGVSLRSWRGLVRCSRLHTFASHACRPRSGLVLAQGPSMIASSCRS